METGAVTWKAHSLKTAYLACLWSRFSSRILLRLAQFEATTAEDLYQGAGRVDWSRHFNNTTNFAVFSTLVRSEEINHSHYASLKIKDAVVDQFRRRTGKRPDVNVRAPGLRLHLHVDGKSATLSLDLSGESLHRRGYRSGAGEAPLKETLAAALAHLSGVRVAAMSPENCLLDPMCGSGTLLIEAALIIGDSAPGLLREHFGFQHWSGHNEKMWETLLEEAVKREDQHADTPWPMIIGYDADPQVVAVARKNVMNAGLSDRITIRQGQLARLQAPTAQGLLLTNPPYGERLSEKEAVKYLYRALGRIFRRHFSAWNLGFFTAYPDLADMLKVTWQERHRLYNGPLKCRLLTASAPGPAEEPDEQSQHILQENDPTLPATDFAERLSANCRRLFPWAKENNITCFRIYDADIPEYNLAIDLYEDWVHVQDYEPSATVSQDKAEERFHQALQVIRHLLDVPHSRLFIKKRRRQRGKEQYQKRSASTGNSAGKTGKEGKLQEVHEGGCRFLVNFTDYLDTGLFLDHRKTRTLLAELAQGRTFLNLFAYTGSATVYAAKGGALATQTVDLSEKYLIRAQANLALNGFGGSPHQFTEADCLQWLQSCPDRYGLIFVDPPTFSNSRHKNIVFDVQRNHPELLRLAMNRLVRNGVLIFSTNFRKFRLDTSLEQEFAVREITEQTLPKDFQGKGNIHRCWQFRHHHEEE